MMTYYLIPARNVLRNHRRTALTLMVIVFGAVALMMAGGFFASNFEALREVTIRNGLGHMQIFTEEYLAGGEDKPLSNGVQEYRTVQDSLEKYPEVRATTGQVDFVGLISNGDKSEAFLGRGVEPEGEAKMGFTTNVKSGQALTSSAEGEHQALLGTGLAETLKVKIGDTLTRLSTTTQGALNGIDVRVVGTYSTGIQEYDNRSLKVTLATSQTLINTDRVTKVIVKLNDTALTDGVLQRVKAAGLVAHGHKLRAQGWKEMATFYHQVQALYGGIFFFLGIIIVILVVLSSSNTMMMTVMERIQEIGTLMAIGARRWQILVIFLVEGLIIGSVGGLLGVAVSVGLMKVINAAGIMLPPPPTFSSGIPLKISFVPVLAAAVFVLVALSQTASAVIPAMRGARLKIVDALRHI